MSVETARNIPKQIEDGIIAENPYFYVSNILELRHFNIDEIEVIKSRFLTPIQLKLISSLRKGTSLDIFCSPDDYHLNVTTARTNGETRQLFSIDKSHNVYAAPKYPEIPDFPKQLLSKIAEEKGLSGVQLQLEDRYQVSSEYLGKTLGIIVDHLKDHFEHLKDYYGLFTLFKKINFKDDSVMNNILKKDWSAVKNNFKLRALD